LLNYLSIIRGAVQRVVLESMVQSQEFTVLSLHEEVSKEVNVSRKVVASMTGYIGSRLGILHMNKKSYRTPRTYALKDEYADIARAVLASL
jgi:hypothetical protein